MKELVQIKINGFKSIQKLDLKLRSINVLIGANGAGKSNFISFFRMLNELIEGRLQFFVGRSGGANAMLHYGTKVTTSIDAKLYFDLNGYEIQLNLTEDDQFVFGEECLHLITQSVSHNSENRDTSGTREILGSGHKESLAVERYIENDFGDVPYILSDLRSWKVYHFHDTSLTSGIKQTCGLHENNQLKQDAGNLAAFLYMLQKRHPPNYQLILRAVRRIFPKFKEFALRPNPLNPDTIRLEWYENGSDYRFGPHQLSDGTLRFMSLATLLLQPDLPSMILIDEPELGLHPSALTVIAGLMHSCSNRTQLIITTQSATFLNEFEPEDVITVERRDSLSRSSDDAQHGYGESVFLNHNRESLRMWLKTYSLGELWEMNVLGGRP